MKPYVTFHEIITEFEKWQKQSPVMNSFGFGNLVDFGRTIDGEEQNEPVQYPFMFVVPQSITYEENTTNYQISVIFADLLNTDMMNQMDCVSDMSLQARRFLSAIKRGQVNNPDMYDLMDIDLPSSAIPFLERMADNVAGVALNLFITVFEDINDCDYYIETTPNEVDGLFAWYDLQDVNTVTIGPLSSELTQLLDKSGNDYTLTLPSGHTYPTYQQMTTSNLSGFYSMYDSNMTGLAHNLSSPVSFSSGFTMFIVSDWEGTDSFRSVFNISTGNTFSSLSDIRSKSIGCTRINGNVTIDGNDYRVEVLGGSIPASNNAFITTSLQEGITSDLTMYLYGTQNFEDLTSVSDVSPDEFDYILLGDFVPGFAGDINICEAIIYNRKLTDDEYNGVLDYLKRKYNYSNWS